MVNYLNYLENINYYILGAAKKNKAPPKKKSKVAAPKNNVANYEADWVSKKAKSTFPTL